MSKLDPALPEFQRTWDEALMVEVFANRLRLAEGWTVQRAKLVRIRHRLGRRGIVQYAVTMACDSAIRRFLVTGYTYTDRAPENVARKIEEWAPSSCWPMQSLVAVEPRLRLTLQAFPADRRIPGLKQLDDLAGLQSIRQIVGDKPGPAEVVRHRPGIAATVRLGGQPGNAFVKLYRSGADDVAFDRWTRMSKRLPFFVDAPIRLPRHNAIAASVVGGESLATKPDPNLADVVDLLEQIHQHPAPPGAPQHGPDDRVHRATEWLVRLLPETKPLLTPPAAPIVAGSWDLVHGDLKPDHVIIKPDGAMRLIDLDSSGGGRALSDLATLAARMRDPAHGDQLVDIARRRRPNLAWDSWPNEWGKASVALALHHAQLHADGWEQSVISALERSAP